MVDLVLRPTHGDEKAPDTKDKWSLQLRWHESLGPTEYRTLCRVDDRAAREIIRAGKADWLFGDPDKHMTD